jgi:hypothetical protein
LTKGERAAQIWPMLTIAAARRQLLTYDMVARAIGVPRPGLGQLLEPVQSFCILNRLPPLSALLVSEVTGIPGEGFIAASDVPRAQAEVFAHDWQGTKPPDPVALEDAARRLPSNGRSLTDLLTHLSAG